MTRTCKGTKEDGTPCKSPIVGKDGYCPQHRSQVRASRREPWTRERVEGLLASVPSGTELSLKGQNLMGLNLSGLDLRRCSLEKANLTAANLRGANLQKVNLAEAILRGANLESANLTEAVLEGAQLDTTGKGLVRVSNTNLQHATLRRANLERANLEKANMENAKLQGANLTGANLRGATLYWARLEGAKLGYSDLEGAHLGSANLQGARLTGANLQKAYFFQAVLEGANLQFADLRGVSLIDVSGTNLDGIYVYGAKLDRTDLTREMLVKIGEEQEKQYYRAKEAYLALKQNFESLGRYDDASWAYIQERQMEKAMHNPFLLWRELSFPRQGVVPLIWLNRIRSKRDYLFLIAVGALKWVADWVVELLCGYGESVWRVLGWMVFTILVLGPLLTKLGGGLYFVNDTWTFYWSINNPIFRWLYGYSQYLLYTVSAFTTMDSDNLKAGNDLVRLFTAGEALMGIFLTGLLGFVAGNRIRRS